MTPTPALDGRRNRILLLAGIAAASVALWQTEAGSLMLFPFTMLATWFHEMAHGLTAILFGSGFDRLVIHADGSGYAVSSRPVGAYRVTTALIAAAGPMGPAIAGSLLMIASRDDDNSRRALCLLGAALVLSTLVWVRSIIGWLVLPGIGIALLAVSMYGTVRLHRFTVQLLGVQACISAWRTFDYLFSDGGYVGGVPARSDTAAIADVLILPYWTWGAAISAAIVVMICWSTRAAFRR